MNRLTGVLGALAAAFGASAVWCTAPAMADGSTGCWDNVLDFSLVQGQGDWHYGYWYPQFQTFLPMSETNTVALNTWSVDFNRPAPAYWTFIGPGVLHPNGAVNNNNKTVVEQEAVLRWVSSVNDGVTFDIHVDCADVGGGGTTFKIYLNSGQIANIPIAWNDTVGQDFQLIIPAVVGTVVDFVVSTGDGQVDSDSTTVEISAKVDSFNAAADLNNDCHVDGADLGLLLAAWGEAGPFADLNNDGIVDGADLGILLAAWTG
jgi:hypothetical protein